MKTNFAVTVNRYRKFGLMDNQGGDKSPHSKGMNANRSILRWVTYAVVVFPAVAGAQTESPSLLPDLHRAGWIRLFDGATLYGWTPTSDANWHVENGAIAVSAGPGGFLRSNAEFRDFELSLEFRAKPQTNSGVFVRSISDPKDPTTDCLEINIAPSDNPFPTGSIVAHVRSDTVPAFKEGWRRLVVTSLGTKVTVAIDGEQTAAVDIPTNDRRGYILLQFNRGGIWFREIRLRPLEMKPIRVDPTLSAWMRYPDLAGEFHANADGELKVTGGPGQLETRKSYGDFVLQLECRTNARNLNSGVFFRCIPGARLMGYESQIHNGFRNSPEDPFDAGTGAIFRRCNARRIVAKDGEWFTKTIVANGPHLAVWVNGYQVSDWTDDRPPHENPREGMRLEPGTIMLQAHDPTTDVDFRNIRIQSLNASE